LFPPSVGIIFKLEGGHGYFLGTGVVVDAEDLVNLECP
jgi:hypothetical protein